MFKLPNDLGRIAAHDRVGRYILRDDRSRRNDGVLSNRHTRHDRHIRADPGVFINPNTFTFQHISVFKIVIIRDDGDMRPDLHVLPQRNAADGHGGKAVVDEHMLPELHLPREVDLHRGKDSESFRSKAAEEIVQSGALFCTQRLCTIQAMERFIGAVQFLDRRTLFL